MAEQFDQTLSGSESLASRLEQNEHVSSDEAVRIVATIARQVQSLHESGRWHGRLTVDAIFLSSTGQVTLQTYSGPWRSLGRSTDEAILPPYVRLPTSAEIPLSLTEARSMLAGLDIGVDPIQIDLYQLAALLCRASSGEPIGRYLRSPSAKSKVPAGIRPILDRILNVDSQQSIESASAIAHELAAQFPSAIQPLTDISVAKDIADDAADDAADDTTDDTTPNLVTGARQDDTTPSIVADATEAANLTPLRSATSREKRDTLPFERLGHYEIVERIGHGGMGDVYRGYERSLDRTVAIKVLPTEFTRHEDFVRRFYAEATAAARLSHPNVIDIYFISEDQGHHFFAMQFVEGETLADLIVRRTKLPVTETLPIVMQALVGLAAAHKQGLVHRDIKPGNILLDRKNQRALVADFGLVKSLQASENLTATGMVMGTVDYISPEQGRGLTVDPRSDLYSIGVLLYRMLSGRLPFAADSATAMIFQHVYETPPPLSDFVAEIPAPLTKIVDKLLAKSPDDRYASADLLLADLRALLDHRTLPSGADAATSTNEDVSFAVPNDLLTSIVVSAPRFDDEPLLPASLGEVARTGFLGRLWNRVIDRVGEHAPEFLDHLQNTQQQADHAIGKYERRQRDLQDLASEADAVLLEFRQQADEWRDAADRARVQAESATDDDTARAALREQNLCRERAQSAEAQIADQQEQLQTIQTQLAKVSARLETLRSQRDILAARLRVAQAQARMHGARIEPNHRSQRRRTALIAVAAVLLMTSAIWFVRKAITPAIPPRLNELSPIVNEEAPPVPNTNPSITSTSPDYIHFSAIPEFLRHVGRSLKTSSLTFAPPIVDSLRIGLAVGLKNGQVRCYSLDAYEGAAESQPVTFQGDDAEIHSLAYSPDRVLLAAGDSQGVIRIWKPGEPQSTVPFRELRGNTSDVTYLQFNHNGTRLISVEKRYGTLRIWDVMKEREVQVFQNPSGARRYVRPVTHDPSGKWAAIMPNSHDGNAILIDDYDNGRKQTIFRFGENGLEYDAYRGGPEVVDVIHDDFLKHPFSLWDAGSPGTLVKLAEDVIGGGVARDGSTAVTLMADGSIVVWDLEQQAEISRIIDQRKNPIKQHFTTVVVSQDGTYAATIHSWDSIVLWRLHHPSREQDIKTRYFRESLHSVAIAPDGFAAAVGTATGIHYWDFSDGDRKSPTNPRHGLHQDDDIQLGRPVTSLSFTPTATGIIYGTGQLNSDSNVLGMAEITKPGARGHGIRGFDTGLRNKQYQGHMARITASALLSHGRKLISASRDQTVRLWETNTGLELKKLELDSPINDMAVSPDESRFLVAAEDHSLRLYDMQSFKEITRLAGHTFLVLDVAWSPDGARLVSASADRTVRVWDAKTLETVAVLKGHTDRVNCVAAVKFGRYVVSGSDDGTVRYWDANAGKQLRVFRGHIGPVTGVAVDPFGTRAISCSLDRTTKTWDLDTASEAKN